MILLYREKKTVHALFIYYSYTVHGSHDTIHTFKNYFTTVFSVFSFSNNKFNPTDPISFHFMSLWLLTQKKKDINTKMSFCI